MIETAIGVGILILMYFGRNTIKDYFDDIAESATVSRLEEVPERIKKIQEINKQIDDLEKEYGDLQSTEQVKKRARGK